MLLASGGTFDTTANRLFKIVAASGITLDGTNNLAADTYVTDLFALDTSGLGISGGTFTVLADYNSASSTDLVLRYDQESAPEPTTAALVGLGGSAVLGRRRRRAVAA